VCEISTLKIQPIPKRYQQYEVDFGPYILYNFAPKGTNIDTNNRVTSFQQKIYTARLVCVHTNT